MLAKLNAQTAHGSSVSKSQGFRLSFLASMVLMLVAMNFSAVKAQQWTGEYYILESNAQPGDAVTLVVSVGDASHQVSSQSAITVTIPYNTDKLTPEGIAEVEADNSFFVDPGTQFSYSVEVDESVGEITLEIDLPSPAVGSGYGELARIKGIMVLEDILKKPFSQLETTNSGIQVYPNPIGMASSQLNVTLPNGHLGMARLYNLTGQLMIEQQFESGQASLSMNLSGLSAGRYSLQVPGDGLNYSVVVEVK